MKDILCAPSMIPPETHNSSFKSKPENIVIWFEMDFIWVFKFSLGQKLEIENPNKKGSVRES